MCEDCFYHYDAKREKSGRLLFRRKRAFSRKLILLLAIESVRLARIFERLADTALGAIAASRFSVPVALASMAISLFMIIGAFVDYVRNPSLAVGVAKTIKENPLRAATMIPGLDPIIPIFEGLIAFVITASVHEAFHALAAARLRIGEPRAVGLLFLLGLIPVGAYTDVNPIFLKRNHTRASSAGIFSNILVALSCWGGMVIYAAATSQPLRLGLLLYPPALLRLHGIAVPPIDLVISLLSWISFFNLWIGILNALPIPGFDGYYVLAGVLTPRMGATNGFRVATVTGLSVLGIMILLLLFPTMLGR